MKILMTGATGLVGTALGQALTQKGYEVSALLRSENSIVHFPCRRFYEARSAVAEADVLINLAGANIAEKRWTAKRKKELRDSRIKTCATLAEAAMALNKKFKLVVSATATGYYGDCADELLPETAPAGNDFLSQICVDWEDAARKIPTERLFLPRIGVVLSLEGGFLKQVAPMFTVAGASPLGSGRQWFSWIHIDDLVAILVHAIEDEKLEGVANAVAPEPVTNAELTTELGKRLKVYPAPPVPTLALKSIYGELGGALVSSQRALPEVLRAGGFRWKFSKLEVALANLYPELKTGEIKFVYTHWLPKKREELWPFFSSEKNLERITPPFLNFKVLNKTTPDIGAGTEINYRLKLFGIPFKWKTRIEQWQEPDHFVDNQAKGPYAKWHHRHDFAPLCEGTLMRDSITFKLPMGWFCRLVALKQVTGTVDTIFQYRTKIIDQTFSSR